MAVESTGATVAEAARAVSAFRNQVDASPLLAMDATQPEDTGPVAPDASLARLRFRISGRVAAIADPGDVGVSEPADDADALEIGLD
jgi:hypothetical protein